MSKKRLADDNQRLGSVTLYEVIAKDGREELARTNFSLACSAIAAGFCICFSLLGEAYLKMRLSHMPHSYLIENIGYTFGFLIVVLGRLQLFTENTITVILPLFENFNRWNFTKTLKLWMVVFLFNMVGTFIVAYLLIHGGLASGVELQSMIEISKHAVIHDFQDLFIRGIPAGFLIASLVWLVAGNKTAAFPIIFFTTYLIAIGDYTHVVAGSAEAFLLILNGDISIMKGISYIVAAGLGNIVGGTGLFAILAYGQVKDEI
ncbi:MAG: transporter (formate/nitrite transporter family protein) [Rickettsiales bacterium]|nr:transporter (formate/nitrite transporter family protein) [Rickettsiales bacterium]